MMRILWTVIGLMALTLVLTPRFFPTDGFDQGGAVMSQTISQTAGQPSDKTWMSVAVQFVQKHFIGKEKISRR